MKPFFQVLTLTMAILSMTACHITKTSFDGSEQDYLENDRGGLTECFTDKDSRTGELYHRPILRSGANAFWKDNNLPKGTLDFVCKDGKAYLPKDCQGNSLNRQQILTYWNRYQLPKGLVHFDCSTGTPKVPANELDKWKNLERQTPTCKGGKACI